MKFDNAMHDQACRLPMEKIELCGGGGAAEVRQGRVQAAERRSWEPEGVASHMTGTLRKWEVPTAPAFSTERVRARARNIAFC